MTWNHKYEGAPWVYDDDTGDIIGVRDPDGSTHFFVFGNGGKKANSIAFDTYPDVSQPLADGEIRWNTVDQTVDLKLPGGVTLQIGQELNQLFRNNTGATIANGAVVYVTGSTGVFPTIGLAQANSEAASSVIIGVTTMEIPKNIQGFVTTYGLVRDIDTSSLTEGGAVWLSPSVAGGMTDVKPSAPDHLVLVGYCIRSHPTLGSIYVKPQNGYELDELHNVKITNPQDGQVLKYSASLGVWINANP